MPFKIVRNDITKMHVDAIVNTANEEPRFSSGVDVAVYKAAGEEVLAKYIIHAVSPCYKDGKFGEEQLLRECYSKSLKMAHEYKCKTIALPLISTGDFGYPKEEGMRIALDEINVFLMSHDMLIYLVVFDDTLTKQGLNLYTDLETYIDCNYVSEKRTDSYSNRFFNSKSIRALLKKNECCMGMRSATREEERSFDYIEVDDEPYEDFLAQNESALKERMKHMSDTFTQYLLYLIEAKGLTNAEVYKRAIITKQLFSKIKLNSNYHPDKATAMRLCVGAKLNIDETKDLLGRAGYALSPCDKRDIIFSFFIENNVYDMIEIDIALEEHDLPCFIE